MHWCPADASECPALRALEAGAIHDHGGTDFAPVPGAEAELDAIEKACLQVKGM